MLRKEAKLIEGFMSLPRAGEKNRIMLKIAEDTLMRIVKEAQDEVGTSEPSNPGWYDTMSSMLPDSLNLPESFSDLGNWEAPPGFEGAIPSIGSRNDAMADAMEAAGIAGEF